MLRSILIYKIINPLLSNLSEQSLTTKGVPRRTGIKLEVTRTQKQVVRYMEINWHY